MNCRACGSTTSLWWDLGKVPLANYLRKDACEAIPSYPLAVERCESCEGGQIAVPVDPAELFAPSYPFRPSVSPGYVQRCREIEAHYVRPGDRVLDIGGCDTTLVDGCRARGATADLIDPTVGTGFFPAATRDWEPGTLNAIFSLNVLAHVIDPKPFAVEVARLLESDGFWIIEVPLFEAMVARGELEAIYHEHQSYFTLKGLLALVESVGLYVRYVQALPEAQGGSVRIVASPMPRDDQHGWWVQSERRGYFAERLQRLQDWTREGRAVGFCASARAAMLCHHAQLGPESLRYIVDDTPSKQGWIAPTDIPIVSRARLAAESPDTIVILSANVAREVEASLKTSARVVVA